MSPGGASLAAQPQPSNSKGAWLGWILAAGVVLVLIKAGSGDKPATGVSTNNSDVNLATTTEVAEPANVQLPAVDAPAVYKAARHLRLALDAEGFPGAMVYSQNCFESLTRSFSWAKLDQCEAFDALAQVAISESAEVGTEGSYFNKDALQSRFTVVALARHADPGSSEAHISKLMQVALARIPDLESRESDYGSVTTTTGELSDESDGAPAVTDGNTEDTDLPQDE
jgi:hypothetical protein